MCAPRKLGVLGIALGLGGLIGALLWFNKDRPKCVAKIGDYCVFDRDVERRNRIIRIYYPGETRDLGLDQLKRAYTFAEILRRHDHAVTPEALKNEDERIQKNTLMPEILAQIRAIFDGDTESYYQIYVLPTLTERVIYYEFFLRDPGIQKDSMKAAESFLNEARADYRLFAALARDRGIALARFSVSAESGIQWETPELSGGGAPSSTEDPVHQAPPQLADKISKLRKTQESEEGKRWIDDVVRRLKPGELFDRVVDRGEAWHVVRFIEPIRGKRDCYRMEAAVFPKADFATWIQQEEAKIARKY